MGKIFTGQTDLTIKATVGVDITGATATLIKFKKPTNETGDFTASIEDAALGIIKYEIQAVTDIDQYGAWTFWAHVTFADGDVAAGESFKVQVFQEGGDLC